jgi:GNAT superfamily N-acetyltransferase
MTIKIRKATLGDLPILLEFEQQLIKVERPMDISLEQQKKIIYYDIGAFIKSKKAAVFVAVADNEIIGSGYGLIKNNDSKFKHATYGYVGFIFVLEKYRGKGTSSLILDQIFNWFKTKNIIETRLQVYQENPSAIKAYEKVGFEKNLIEMIHYLE